MFWFLSPLLRFLPYGIQHYSALFIVRNLEPIFLYCFSRLLQLPQSISIYNETVAKLWTCSFEKCNPKPQYVQSVSRKAGGMIHPCLPRILRASASDKKSIALFPSTINRATICLFPALTLPPAARRRPACPSPRRPPAATRRAPPPAASEPPRERSGGARSRQRSSREQRSRSGRGTTGTKPGGKHFIFRRDRDIEYLDRKYSEIKRFNAHCFVFFSSPYTSAFEVANGRFYFHYLTRKLLRFLMLSVK